MKKLVWENVWKNILVVFIAILLFPHVLSVMKNLLNLNNIGNVLNTISILLVTVCFANFEFKYSNSNMKSLAVRLLAHVTTFLFLFLTAILLSALSISIGVIYPTVFLPISIFSIILYFSIVLYDFWDLIKNS